MALASLAAMITGIVIITDPSTLGVSADTWKIASGWLALASGILSGIATAFRANLVPGVQSGIGNEPPITSTVTETTTTGGQ